MSTYRTAFIDYDARPKPKTARHCVMCQRDIKPCAKARVVHLVNGGPFALHPDDEALYESDAGDLGKHLLGMDCARKLGLEWSRPEEQGAEP